MCFKIEGQPSSRLPYATPKIEVYKDTKDIFNPNLLSQNTGVGKYGLKNGETHAPSAECQICDMIFSNLSSLFVEALLGKEQKDVALVYQLRG